MQIFCPLFTTFIKETTWKIWESIVPETFGLTQFDISVLNAMKKTLIKTKALNINIITKN